MQALSLIARMAGVLCLLWMTLRWVRRRDLRAMTSARRGTAKPVALLGQTRLSKTASIAVVRLGGQAYAVGVTDREVRLLVTDPIELHEDEPFEEPAETAAHMLAGAISARLPAPRAALHAAMEQARRGPSPRSAPIDLHGMAAQPVTELRADGSAGPDAWMPDAPLRT